ncbi:MAG TPA: DUF1800 domain-containing protein [Marmoricola sp.]|nr:DUF1800 domain-containing protein [Marmoricola sp.]
MSRRTLARVAATAAATTAVSGGVLLGVPGEATAAPVRRRRKRRHKHRHKHHHKKRPSTPTPPAPPPVTPDAVLDARALHVLRRFTGGWTTGLTAEVAAAGGIDQWFASQLDATSVPDDFYAQSASWWYSILASTADLWARDRAGTEGMWVANANYERWSMLRRMFSRRQVLETMANFWENHLHVPGDADGVALFRSDYGQMIRRNALGRFDTLLLEATTHPAMGVYLGNAISTKKAPNENLGRELLELHTVGRTSGYTEDDVKSSARILTGYRVDEWNTWNVWYDANAHWVGPVTVLGFSDANAAADGRTVTAAYLHYLAHHPATARRIAWKLAVRFVSDDPSAQLVDHLAQVYLANDTAIVPVLRALVVSDEFLGSAGAKVRTPDEDVVATYRALGVQVLAPTAGGSAANAMLWQCSDIGLRPFGWTRPDGRPDQAEAWSSVSRMLNSFDVHYTMSGGWWPTQDAVYRTPVSWLPAASVRFDELVDHLSRTLLGSPASALIQTAAAQATGLAPDTVITATHALVRWEMPRLLTVFLDSPTHFTR